MTDPRTEIVEARRIRALWAGLLLAPVAFFVNLELGYLLVRPSCSRDHALPIHAVHTVSLVLALFGLSIAWRSWQSEGTRWSDDEGGPVARTRFMAGLGVTLSALLVLTLVAQWIPTFVLSPCQ
jgi:O-antigen/teichoic acid export membrane protein